MDESREYLRHDLTALFAFIDSITDGLATKRSVAAYGPAADLFFEFVAKLSETCKRHISAWTVADDEEFEDRREELNTLRAAWSELHFLVKPTLDADTLQAPLAVVDGLVRRFQELPGCEKTNFALFHTSEFNYTEVRTASLGSIITKFSSIISKPPPFPPDLGLIGIPYSQGRTAFANCLVAHEMGHYRYRRLPLAKKLKARVDEAVRDLPGFEDKADELADALINRLAIWAEELFCDLFGVMLIGPCYTYAYIEAYDLSVILDSSGQLSDERLLPRLEFYEKYPSHIFRLQQQAALLRGTEWWGYITASRAGKEPSRSATLLSRVRELPLELHIQNNEKQGKLIPVLETILPMIRAAIGETFDGVDDGFACFSGVNQTIQAYLAAGIVPSTLNVRRKGGKREETDPFPASPLVLLNSGMDFYLNRISDLIGSIPGEKNSSYERRLHWVRRVEEWIAKAIEDQSLEGEVASVDSGTGRN